MTTPISGPVRLASGGHSDQSAMCAMELAAYLAGEPWSDHPACVSPVIAAFLRSWNDSLNDADRQMLIGPSLRAIGTATTSADETTRAWMAIDWLVRVQAPAWLRLAGLTEHAQALEGLARYVDAATASAGQPTVEAARSAAAAWAAARAAARDAAWAAARAAAGDALRPTVVVLQASALELLDAMIAVGKVEAPPIDCDRLAACGLTLPEVCP